MTLYYSPGACSLSPHIALREAGLPFEVEKVDLRTKKTESGKDFLAINPKGQVPSLQLDDGGILTEGPVIVQEWLNFITSELHKSFSPLFNPAFPEEAKKLVREGIGKHFDYLRATLEKGPFLMGEQFTIADAYLFTVVNWTRWTHIDLAPWPWLRAYQARVAARPHVSAALAAEFPQK
jgi:glutathione S-transferase